MGIFSFIKPKKPETPSTKMIQMKLKALGFYSGKIDSDLGPKTRMGIISFKKSVGLKGTSYVGPITWSALKSQPILPWICEITKVFGLHERRDKRRLSRWLVSDGKTLGDPTKLPWCGDAVETAIKRGLPKQSFPPNLTRNPYWARNWAQFGEPCGEVYGAVVSFVRGSGGHVGFLVGVSKDGKKYRVRGGNQSNMVNDTWISKDRLLARRWPSSASVSLQKPAPRLSSNGAFVSTNEA